MLNLHWPQRVRAALTPLLATLVFSAAARAADDRPLLRGEQPECATYPAHCACAAGRTAVLKDLVELGFDIKTLDARGRACIHYAAANGQLAAIDFVLGAGGPIDQGGGDGRPALNVAVVNGEAGAVDHLIAKGASVDIGLPLHDAVTADQADILVKLVAAGANLNKGAPDRRAALALAVATNNLAAARVLIAKGAALFDNGNRNDTPLTYKIDESTDDAPTAAMVTGLIHEAGVSPNAPGRRGQPPLELVVAKPKVLKALLDAGADVNVRFSDGRPALYTAVNRAITDLRIAVPNAKAFFKALVERGADVNGVHDAAKGLSHFHALVAGFHGELVESLLAAHRADPNLKTGMGRTPLSLAVDFPAVRGIPVERVVADRERTVKALLNAGASAAVADDGGDLPLHKLIAALDCDLWGWECVQPGAVAVGRLLLGAGAPVDPLYGNGEPLWHRLLANRLRGARYAFDASFVMSLIGPATALYAGDDGQSALFLMSRLSMLDGATADGRARFERLVALGLSPKAFDAAGKPLFTYYLNQTSGSGGALARLDAFLAVTPDAALIRDARGGTLLHQVCGGLSYVSGLADQVVARLAAVGLDVNAVDADGRTFFANCMAHQSLADTMIPKLAALGVSVVAADNAGDTPLHLAAAANNPKRIRMLIEAGADPSAVNGAGERPEAIAARKGWLFSVYVLRHNAEIAEPLANLPVDSNEDGVSPYYSKLAPVGAQSWFLATPAVAEAGARMTALFGDDGAVRFMRKLPGGFGAAFAVERDGAALFLQPAAGAEPGAFDFLRLDRYGFVKETVRTAFRLDDRWRIEAFAVQPNGNSLVTSVLGDSYPDGDWSHYYLKSVVFTALDAAGNTTSPRATVVGDVTFGGAAFTLESTTALPDGRQFLWYQGRPVASGTEREYRYLYRLFDPWTGAMTSLAEVWSPNRAGAIRPDVPLAGGKMTLYYSFAYPEAPSLSEERMLFLDIATGRVVDQTSGWWYSQFAGYAGLSNARAGVRAWLKMDYRNGIYWNLSLWDERFKNELWSVDLAPEQSDYDRVLTPLVLADGSVVVFGVFGGKVDTRRYDKSGALLWNHTDVYPRRPLD